MTKGPILIVDDDNDDQEIYADAIKEIGIPNEIRFFASGQEHWTTYSLLVNSLS